MRRVRGVVRLVAALAAVLLGAVLLAGSVRDASARWQARDGAVVPGVVVERHRGYKAWFPSVTVSYAVDGRTFERDLRGHLDRDEQVQVRVVPEDPEVSRVVGEGGAALVLDGAGGLGVVAYGAVEAWRARQALLRRPRPPRDGPAPESERPGDRATARTRLRRGAAAGAAAGAVAWVLLALLLGAGGVREVATALLGTVGSGAAVGALAGLLRSRGAFLRTGRRGAWWFGVVALVAAVPLVLASAAALEG